MRDNTSHFESFRVHCAPTNHTVERSLALGRQRLRRCNAATQQATTLSRNTQLSEARAASIPPVTLRIKLLNRSNFALTDASIASLCFTRRSSSAPLAAPIIATPCPPMSAAEGTNGGNNGAGDAATGACIDGVAAVAARCASALVPSEPSEPPTPAAPSAGPSLSLPPLDAGLCGEGRPIAFTSRNFCLALYHLDNVVTATSCTI